jgi:hypothetical protein
MPIQYFSTIPATIAHITPVPKIAPVRVAKITSPEPMYSAHHTKAGPTTAKIARPLGGSLMGSMFWGMLYLKFADFIL